MSLRLLLLFFSLVLLGTPSAQGENRGSSAEQALTAARNLGLAERRDWRVLLHCRGTAQDACDSAVAGGGFFLDGRGAEKPEEELSADIRALYAAEEGVPPFACRFPARFEWLQSALAPAGVQLPVVDCPDLDSWVAAIQPHGLSLIFPSSFLNNPASAFGHTLIRIDRPGQTDATRLAAYSANFAAQTGGEDPVTYAFLGVFGGYHGFYSVAPYYEIVKQYNDLEDRDIWEYELTFSPAEVRRVVLHLWELRRVPFVYYYFDENCSYQLLALLEVARPSLTLANRFPLSVIPIDTVRVALEDPALLRRAVFRPSLASKLTYQSRFVTAEQTAWALAAADPAQPLDSDRAVQQQGPETVGAADLAYDVITYRTLRGELEGEARDQRAWQLLALRSRLTGPSSIPPVPTPAHRPDEGHATVKVSAGGGWDESRWFSEYTVRPAFHEQIDPPIGYSEGSAISTMETVVRQEEGRGVELQRFTLLDVESFSPRNAFVSPRAWHARLAAERFDDQGGRNPLLYELHGGAGRAYRSPGDGLFYTVLDGDLQAGGGLDDGWALGAGPQAGAVIQLADRLRSRLDGAARYFPAGDEHTEIGVELGTDYRLTPNSALRLEVGRGRKIDVWETRASVTLDFFFSPIGSP